MRQILLTTDEIQHTEKSIKFNGIDLQFSRVTTNISDLVIPFSSHDLKVMIFGPSAQLCADHFVEKFSGLNFKIRAGEFVDSKVRDLGLEQYAYKVALGELQQNLVNPENLTAIQDRRTITKNKQVSTKISRIYEIKRCCFNEECFQSHGSVTILVIGDADQDLLRQYAGGNKNLQIFKEFKDEVDLISCIDKNNIQQYMEILFLMK